MLTTVELTIRRLPDGSRTTDARLTSDVSAAATQLAANVPVALDAPALRAALGNPVAYRGLRSASALPARAASGVLPPEHLAERLDEPGDHLRLKPPHDRGKDQQQPDLEPAQAIELHMLVARAVGIGVQDRAPVARAAAEEVGLVAPIVGQQQDEHEQDEHEQGSDSHGHSPEN